MCLRAGFWIKKIFWRTESKEANGYQLKNSASIHSSLKDMALNYCLKEFKKPFIQEKIKL